MSDKTNQKASVTKVVAWMALFLLLYLPLVLLVLALVAVFIGVFGMGIQVMVRDQVLIGALLILFCGVVGYFCIWPFCKGIFHPFYDLYKRKREPGLEVTREEAPALFQLIETIADQTHNAHPQHVYVTSEANACVFFDSKLSCLFAPAKKNIEVGMGIFRHMSLAETASCLAHEFGHFSQQNMRWGEPIQVVKELITNMMGVNERWNTTVNKMIDFPWLVSGYGILVTLMVKAAGWTEYGLTIVYTKTMEWLYRRMQLSYLELSRKMEYEADEVAARLMGSDNYISFFHKMRENSNRREDVFDILRRMANNGLFVADFWEAYDRADQHIAKTIRHEISWDRPMPEPFIPVSPDRLVCESIYSTHPDRNSRIEALREGNWPQSLHLEGRAWDVLSEAVLAKVAKAEMDDLADYWDMEDDHEVVTKEKLDEIIEKYNRCLPYEPYFYRHIVPFDYEHCEAGGTFDPFDPEAQAIVQQYVVAENTYQNSLAVRDNKDYREATYHGVTYPCAQLPMDEIHDHYLEAESRVKQLDEQICAVALSKAQDPQEIREDYRRIFYAQNFIEQYDKYIRPLWNKADEQYDKIKSSVNSHQFNQIQKACSALNEVAVKYGLNPLDKDLYAEFASHEEIENINQYIQMDYNYFDRDSISTKDICCLMNSCTSMYNNIQTAKRCYASKVMETLKGSESH